MKAESNAVNLITGCSGNNFVANSYTLMVPCNINRFYPL